MVPIESLFCPCCTPALLHSLAQSNPEMLSRQLMLLGTGALMAAIAHRKPKLTQSQLDVQESLS